MISKSKLISPQLKTQLNRFYKIKRGYYSAVLLVFLILFSFAAELFINNRALIVRYENKWHFPTYSKLIPGNAFGLEYDYETNYRSLKTTLAENKKGWVLLPLVPYSPYETITRGEDDYPPFKPSFEYKNYLGTDSAGRDILARLIYGFRIAILFSLLLLVCTYAIGILIGCLMGYLGGIFDLFFQRLIEIWSNIPFLYVIIITSSILVPDFKLLLVLMIIFGWHGLTYYMRSKTYQEKSKLYVMAARSLGASTSRVIFKHILPNSWSIIITFVPFSVASGITSLTALDFLGFGLPPPTPSWGELLSQGIENMDAVWIISSVVAMLTLILTMVTFVGEAVREAFDPKKFTVYK